MAIFQLAPLDLGCFRFGARRSSWALAELDTEGARVPPRPTTLRLPCANGIKMLKSELPQQQDLQANTRVVTVVRPESNAANNWRQVCQKGINS